MAGTETLPTPVTVTTIGELTSCQRTSTAKTTPSITAIDDNVEDGCYNNGDVIDFTVSFSETVTVTGAPRLLLNVSPTAYANYVSGSESSNLLFRYNVGSESVVYLDILTIYLNNGTIKDVASNAVVDATDLTGINYDGTHTITITSPATRNISGGNYCTGDYITVTIASSQTGVTYKLYQDAVYTGTSAVGTGNNLDLNYQGFVEQFNNK